MKKAKNAFAIIGIIFAVIAAALLMLIPVIDGLGLVENTVPAIPFGEYLNLVIARIPEVYNFGWISAFSLEALKVNFPIVVAAVGVILLLVLFILMLCKRHAKGLGWFFSMLILFAASIVVASVVVKPSPLFEEFYKVCIPEGATEAKYLVIAIGENLYLEQLLMLGALIGALVAAGAFILASIFYMAYVCAERKKAKKANSMKKAALDKIESLLGGNK